MKRLIELLTTKDGRAYLFAPTANGISKIKAIICRIKGHPAGPVWYNLGGMEPDYSCKNCKDDL